MPWYNVPLLINGTQYVALTDRWFENAELQNRYYIIIYRLLYRSNNQDYEHLLELDKQELHKRVRKWNVRHAVPCYDVTHVVQNI